MQEQINMEKVNFQKMENDLLKQIMEVSKSMIETFKFRMIYGAKVSKEQNKNTLKDLKQFRSRNWDSKSNRSKAYKKYLNLY